MLVCAYTGEAAIGVPSPPENSPIDRPVRVIPLTMRRFFLCE